MSANAGWGPPRVSTDRLRRTGLVNVQLLRGVQLRRHTRTSPVEATRGRSNQPPSTVGVRWSRALPSGGVRLGGAVGSPFSVGVDVGCEAWYHTSRIALLGSLTT